MDHQKEITKQLKRIANSLENIENNLNTDTKVSLDGESITKEVASHIDHAKANERVVIK